MLKRWFVAVRYVNPTRCGQLIGTQSQAEIGQSNQLINLLPVVFLLFHLFCGLLQRMHRKHSILSPPAWLCRWCQLIMIGEHLATNDQPGFYGLLRGALFREPFGFFTQVIEQPDECGLL